MARFADIVIFGIISDTKLLFVAEVKSDLTVSDNPITSVDRYGERLSKIVSEDGTCYFFFPPDSEEVVLTLGDDTYRVIFKEEDDLFVGKATNREGVEVMIAAKQ